MKSPRLVSQHARIANVIKAGRSLPDLELQSHLGRYACVLVAGLAENSIAEIYGEYCNKRAQPAVASFAIRNLERYQNPKSKRFVEIAGMFSPAWSTDLQTYLDAAGRGDAIDSIMSNRHQIAHGGMPGVTLVRVQQYLKSSLRLSIISRRNAAFEPDGAAA